MQTLLQVHMPCAILIVPYDPFFVQVIVFCKIICVCLIESEMKPTHTL
jgi:hypothetical protein